MTRMHPQLSWCGILHMLNRKTIDEEECAEANVSIRGQKIALGEKQRELGKWLEERQGKSSSAERALKAIIPGFRGISQILMMIR